MLSPLAQPALVQTGLQPVWLLSRALLSRSPRAAVVLAAAASSSSSNDGGSAAPYKKEHLVWEDGFGSRFAGSLLVCCVLAVGASRSPGAWLPAAHGAQAALRRQLLKLCHRLEWWSASLTPTLARVVVRLALAPAPATATARTPTQP